jgi:tRNA 2-thiouridine synthesizing protein B
MSSCQNSLKGTLYIVNTPPNSPERLQACIELLQNDDHLLLIENGVYWASESLSRSLKELPCPITVLECDCQARGVISSLPSCNDDEFVQLTVDYPRSVSWF